MDARLHSQATKNRTREPARRHAGPHDNQQTQAQEARPREHSPLPGAVSSSTRIETTHGQRVSVMSHINSAVAHGSANRPWSESAIPHTESGVSNALHENLNPKRETDRKSDRVGPGKFTRRSTHE